MKHNEGGSVHQNLTPDEILDKAYVLFPEAYRDAMNGAVDLEELISLVFDSPEEPKSSQRTKVRSKKSGKRCQPKKCNSRPKRQQIERRHRQKARQQRMLEQALERAKRFQEKLSKQRKASR